MTQGGFSQDAGGDWQMGNGQSVDRLETSLAREPLGEQIVEALQRAILGGVYKPGDWLVERQVAQEFRVSSIPVREALQELASRGLVTKYPHRGCQVTMLSDDEIQQLVELRALLEPKMLEWAGKNLNGEVVAKLEKQLELQSQAAEVNNQSEFFIHDLAFHRMLWDLSGNKYAAAVLQSTLVPLFATGQMAHRYLTMPNLKEEARKHRSILRHLKAGDTATASEVLLEIAKGYEVHLTQNRARSDERGEARPRKTSGASHS
jgi:DNA-binding GntR family transcriptional regulator